MKMLIQFYNVFSFLDNPCPLPVCSLVCQVRDGPACCQGPRTGILIIHSLNFRSEWLQILSFLPSTFTQNSQLTQEPQCMAWKDGVLLEWSSSTTSPLLPTHIPAGFTTTNYDQLSNLTSNQNLFNLPYYPFYSSAGLSFIERSVELLKC